MQGDANGASWQTRCEQRVVKNFITDVGKRRAIQLELFEHIVRFRNRRAEPLAPRYFYPGLDRLDDTGANLRDQVDRGLRGMAL